MPKFKPDNNDLIANKLLKQYPKVRKQKRIKIYNILNKLNLQELDNLYEYLANQYPEYNKKE